MHMHFSKERAGGLRSTCPVVLGPPQPEFFFDTRICSGRGGNHIRAGERRFLWQPRAGMSAVGSPERGRQLGPHSHEEGLHQGSVWVVALSSVVFGLRNLQALAPRESSGSNQAGALKPNEGLFPTSGTAPNQENENTMFRSQI